VQHRHRNPAQIAGRSVRQPPAIAQDDHRHSADRNGSKTAPLRGGLRREAGPEQVGVALHAGKLTPDPSHGPGLILEVLRTSGRREQRPSPSQRGRSRTVFITVIVTLIALIGIGRILLGVHAGSFPR
jgi:hypothetical protein